MNIYTQSKFETNTFQKLSKRPKGSKHASHMLDDENVSTGKRKMCKKGWACERNAKRMSWEDV